MHRFLYSTLKYQMGLCLLLRLNKYFIPLIFPSGEFWLNRSEALLNQIDQNFAQLNAGAQEFSSYGIEALSFYRAGLLDAIRYELETKDQNQFRFLELGAGDGSVLKDLQAAFHFNWNQLLGIPAQDDRNRIPENPVPSTSYLIFNIERMDLLLNEIGRFDVIFSHFTWSHLIDPVSSLAISYEFLKEGGVLFISLDVDHFSERNFDLEALVEDLESKGLDISFLPEDRLCGMVQWLAVRKSSHHPYLFSSVSLGILQSMAGMFFNSTVE